MMKKTLFFILGVAAITMVACSKNNSVPEPVFEQEEWVENESLPVPISLGQKTLDATLTKAAPVTSSNIEGTVFGIFGVDVKADATWTDNADNIVLRDGYAKYQTGKMQFVNPETDGDVTYYYPMITKYNYTFYGFHTGNEKTVSDYRDNLTTTFGGGGTLYTDLNLGATDILWAKASASDISGKINDTDEHETTLSGFNARYSRYSRKWYLGEYVNYEPVLNFKHLTAALHFWAVAADADAQTSLEEGNATVYSLMVKGVPSRARLCIAEKQPLEGLPLNEGTLTALNSGDSLKMCNALGLVEDLGVRPVIDAGTEIGTGLFILPQSATGMTVSFVLRDPSGYTRVYNQPLPAPTGGEYKAGYKYNFKIIIRSLEKIEIKASVEDWANGFASEDDTHVDDIG